MSGNHRQGQCLALILEVRAQLALHPGRRCAYCGLSTRDGPPHHHQATDGKAQNLGGALLQPGEAVSEGHLYSKL